MTMTKTGTDIQNDIMQMLRGTALAQTVTGTIYPPEVRPRDSQMEDIVVRFTAGQTGDIQSGTVTINIFVADIDPWCDGTLVPDWGRINTLQRAAQTWVESLSPDRSCYHFDHHPTIWTEAENSIGQHFIVVQLRFEYKD